MSAGPPSFHVAVTFDVDLALQTRPLEEVERCLAVVRRLAAARPSLFVSLFVRLDRHVEATLSSPTAVFDEYGAELRALESVGHEIGWHPHPYSREGTAWRQNTDGEAVLGELHQIGPVARHLGMRSVRMGWGFHTTRTMQLLSDQGFEVDTSAIPRPVYSWEESVKDWSPTPHTPFHPSRSDHRVAGEDAMAILEVPMSVVPLPSPTDTEPGVLRYVNLTYHPDALREPLSRWVHNHDHLVTITHAHEVSGREEGGHPLLTYAPSAVEENLAALEELVESDGREVEYVTTSDFVRLGTLRDTPAASRS